MQKGEICSAFSKFTLDEAAGATYDRRGKQNDQDFLRNLGGCMSKPGTKKMLKPLLSGLPVLLIAGVLGMQIAPANASEHNHHGHHGKEFAKFNKAGSLCGLPIIEEWIFVDSPVTPKDMNDGKPAFPEFHNVYIDPCQLGSL